MATTCPATQVDWGSVAFSNNLSSTGQPWDGTWSAELGSFLPGFTPTAANTNQWGVNWRAASRSAYQTSTRYFAGSYSYTAHTAPFTAGARAYFWIFQPAAPQGQWLLLTTPSWTWPAASPFDPIITTWITTDATEAVIGQVPSANGNLTSGPVLNSSLPPLPFNAWQALYFTSSELTQAGISGAAADPDQDGSPNLAEYGAGTQPRLASSFPPPVILYWRGENGIRYAAAQLSRSSRVTGFTWQSEASNDLSDWNAPIVNLTDLPWICTVRRMEPLSNAPQGYFRFRLTP